MPIDVEWQDERGVARARYDGPPISGRLLERADVDSKCLRFIDPYGDTIFNQGQLPVLIAELEAAGARGIDGDTAAIQELITFLRHATDHVHTYIKFIGD